MPNEPATPVEEPVQADKDIEPKEEITKNENGVNPKVTKPKGKLKERLKTWWQKFIHNKKAWIPTAIVVVLLLLLAVPTTRYPLVGAVYKRAVTLQVLDTDSGQPVSEATVKLAGQSQVTDNQGYAKFTSVKPGGQTADISKQYYVSTHQAEFVGLLGSTQFSAKIKPSGVSYTLTIQNLISKTPAGNILIKLANFQSRSDGHGIARIVVPATLTEASVDLSGSGFNDETVKVKLDRSNPEQTLTITPAGQVYYLSKITGKVNVMKANLDGTSPTLVLAGTGNEDSNTAILLPSRDWQYLVLRARRSGSTDSLYLIKTSDGSLKTIDEGDAYFTPIGWLATSFVYQVNRNDLNGSQAGSSKLKSYNPASGVLKVLDQTDDTGNPDITQAYGQTVLLKDSVLYLKVFYANSGLLAGKNDSVFVIKSDGSAKQDLKDFPADTQNLSAQQTKPNEVYVRAGFNNNDPAVFYRYDGSTFTQATYTDATFYTRQPSYFISPSGGESLWFDVRDGQNSIFIGDANSDNGQQVNRLDGLTPYGWYTEDYLLFTKDNDQLFIGGKGATDPIKITDYNSPSYGYYGYGGGY